MFVADAREPATLATAGRTIFGPDGALYVGQPGQAESRQALLGNLGVRFRDVEQGPDGHIHFIY
jgi:glucose/arabinose dehydrogenase